MRKYIAVLTAIIGIAASGDVTDANVVGFMTMTDKEGIFTCPFREIGGENITVMSLTGDNREAGNEFDFYDGNDWVRAVSLLGDDGKVHWFSRSDEGVVDDFQIPIGAAVHYKLSEDSSGLVMTGEAVEDEEGYFKTEFEEIDEKLIDELRQILLGDKPTVVQVPRIRRQNVVVTNVVNVVVTNAVTATNYVTKAKQQVFRLVGAKGFSRRVFFSLEVCEVCDVESGGPYCIEKIEGARFVKEVVSDDRYECLSQAQLDRIFEKLFKRKNPSKTRDCVDAFADNFTKEHTGEHYDENSVVRSWIGWGIDRIIWWVLGVVAVAGFVWFKKKGGWSSRK